MSHLKNSNILLSYEDFRFNFAYPPRILSIIIHLITTLTLYRISDCLTPCWGCWHGNSFFYCIVLYYIVAHTSLYCDFSLILYSLTRSCCIATTELRVTLSPMTTCEYSCVIHRNRTTTCLQQPPGNIHVSFTETQQPPVSNDHLRILTYHSQKHNNYLFPTNTCEHSCLLHRNTTTFLQWPPENTDVSHSETELHVHWCEIRH